MGGGGGGTDINQLPGGFRSWPREKKDIKKGYKFQINQFENFFRDNPLLNTANEGALSFFKDLSSLTGPLKDFAAQIPGFFGGLQNEIGGIQSQVPGLQNQLSGINKGLGGLLGQIPGLQNQFQQGFTSLGNQVGSQFGGLQNQLGNLYGNTQQQFNGLQNQFGNLYSAIPGQFKGIEQGINNLRNQLPQVSALTDPLRESMGQWGNAFNNVFNPVIQGGGYSEQIGRLGSQAARMASSARGAVNTAGSIGEEVLKRQEVMDQRLGNYTQMGAMATGAQGGLAGQIQNLIASDTGLRSGLLGQLAGVKQGKLGLMGNLLGGQASAAAQGAGALSGISGLQSNALGQQFGLQGNLLGQNAGIQQGLLGTAGNLFGQQGQNVAQQTGLLGFLANLTGQKGNLFGQQGSLTNSISSAIQGLQTGGLNQLLGVGNAAVSQFGGLTNPILSYLGNMFSGNQQAAINQAQISAQQNAAGDAKAGGTASGIMSMVGSLAPLLMMSDERVKENIKDTKFKTSEGIPLKTWEYKTNPGVTFLGSTAQDIEAKVPSAVITEPASGVKLVDAKRFPAIRISAMMEAA